MRLFRRRFLAGLLGSAAVVALPGGGGGTGTALVSRKAVAWRHHGWITNELKPEYIVWDRPMKLEPAIYAESPSAALRGKDVL